MAKYSAASKSKVGNVVLKSKKKDGVEKKDKKKKSTRDNKQSTKAEASPRTEDAFLESVIPDVYAEEKVSTKRGKCAFWEWSVFCTNLFVDKDEEMPAIDPYKGEVDHESNMNLPGYEHSSRSLFCSLLYPGGKPKFFFDEIWGRRVLLIRNNQGVFEAAKANRSTYLREKRGMPVIRKPNEYASLDMKPLLEFVSGDSAKNRSEDVEKSAHIRFLERFAALVHDFHHNLDLRKMLNNVPESEDGEATVCIWTSSQSRDKNRKTPLARYASVEHVPRTVKSQIADPKEAYRQFTTNEKVTQLYFRAASALEDKMLPAICRGLGMDFAGFMQKGQNPNNFAAVDNDSDDDMDDESEDNKERQTGSQARSMKQADSATKQEKTPSKKSVSERETSAKSGDEEEVHDDDEIAEEEESEEDESMEESSEDSSKPDVPSTLASEIETFVAKSGHTTDWHFDFQDNFTIQLQGVKRWYVKRGRHQPQLALSPHFEEDSIRHKPVPEEEIMDDAITHPNGPRRANSIGPGKSKSKVDKKLQKKLSTVTTTNMENEMKAWFNADDTSYFGPGQRPPPEWFHDAEVLDVYPGDVLYFPSGMWHKVETISEEHSISINMSIHGKRWAEVVADSLKQIMLRDDLLRSKVTGLLPGADARQFPQRILEGVAARVADVLNMNISLRCNVERRRTRCRRLQIPEIFPNSLKTSEHAKEYLLGHGLPASEDKGKSHFKKILSMPDLQPVKLLRHEGNFFLDTGFRFNRLASVVELPGSDESRYIADFVVHTGFHEDGGNGTIMSKGRTVFRVRCKTGFHVFRSLVQRFQNGNMFDATDVLNCIQGYYNFGVELVGSVKAHGRLVLSSDQMDILDTVEEYFMLLWMHDHICREDDDDNKDSDQHNSHDASKERADDHEALEHGGDDDASGELRDSVEPEREANPEVKHGNQNHRQDK